MQKIRTILPLTIPALFLLIFLPAVTYRISDANVYLATAARLLDGAVLYRDLFFTNLPLYPYYVAGILWLAQGNELAYFSSAVLEFALAAILLIAIQRRYGLSAGWQALSALALVFSHLTLISRSPTGMSLCIVFALAGILLLLRKRYVPAGAMLGLMVLTKGYAAPVLAGIAAYTVIHDRKSALRLSLAAGGIILGGTVPFLVQSPRDFLDALIGFSATRVATAGRTTWYTFLFYNIGLLMLFAVGIALQRRWTVARSALLGYGAFLILFRDAYIMYFTLLAPFVAIEIRHLATTRFEFIRVAAPVVIIISVAAALANTFGPLYHRGTIPDVAATRVAIRKLNPDFVYGPPSIAPLFAYLSDAAFIDGQVDTNAQLFQKEILSKSRVETALKTSRVVVIALGRELPGQGVAYTSWGYDVALLKKCELFREQEIVPFERMTRIGYFLCKPDE